MAYRLSRSNTSSRTRNMIAGSGKRTATKRRLNRKKYAALLTDALPRVIETEEELERAARLIEPLLNKGEQRAPEEDALCRLLLKLIDDYQKAHPSIPNLSPHEALRALMEERNLRQ